MMYNSTLAPLHDDMGARWIFRSRTKLVSDYGESTDQRRAGVHKLGLIDLSPLPRLGVKGNKVAAWIHKNGYRDCESPDAVSQQSDGRVLCRLSADEYLLLTNISAQVDSDLWHSNGPADCFPIDRQASHSWIAVCGQHSFSVINKLCGLAVSVDTFSNKQMAQTQFAILSAVVFRLDVAGTPVFHILTDSSFIHYLWNCLIDAAAEFDGRPYGICALDELGHSGDTNV